MFIGADNPTTSELTRKSLGWAPRELGLLPDILDNYCRAEATTSKYS